jgi:hypothetical protein
MQKLVIIASFIAALSPVAANAACRTSALAGTWVVINDEGSPCLANVNTAGVISGGCGPGRIALSSTCRLTGSVGGRAFEGRTEAIASNSPLVPNLMIARIGGPGFLGYRR